MRKFARKLGFTLMEVNLAIFIMAGGVMAMVSLYPLGYRESEQSRDDVIGAMVADAVFNQLEGVLSSRAITWEKWKSAVRGAEMANGWRDHCKSGSGGALVPKTKDSINSKSRSVFQSLVNCGDGSATFPSEATRDYTVALVAQPGWTYYCDGATRQSRKDYSRVALSLRCVRHAGQLFAAPIYYTEVRFQGDQKGIE